MKALATPDPLPSSLLRFFAFPRWLLAPGSQKTNEDRLHTWRWPAQALYEANAEWWNAVSRRATKFPSKCFYLQLRPRSGWHQHLTESAASLPTPQLATSKTSCSTPQRSLFHITIHISPSRSLYSSPFTNSPSTFPQLSHLSTQGQRSTQAGNNEVELHPRTHLYSNDPCAHATSCGGAGAVLMLHIFRRSAWCLAQ